MAARKPAHNRQQLLRLVWSRPAAEDRRAIRQYIAAANPRAAVALDELISVKAAHLVRHPALGRPGRVPDTRELVVHRNDALIYDLVEGEFVRVLRVLHAARQWPPAQGAARDDTSAKS